MKFCGQCGALLKILCSSCGFENPPRFKFCGECGAPLADQVPIPKTDKKDKKQARHTQVGRRAPEAERRQLTVMFCDLVDSTALSERLDPEVLREMVREYQEACAGVVDRFEGHIAQYLGDGILVYFGYPQAHEDDAQRAVRSGLEIVRELLRLNTRLQSELDVTLAVRIGIHTGLAVIGEVGGGARREQLALGETPNIAARLQRLAEPNAVVVSAATFRLIQGFFASQALGAHPLKGISQPMQVYSVLHETDVRSRFEAAVTSGLTPLIGKKREVERLLRSWKHVEEENGQVVSLSGEAGIGKSRLLQVFKERLTEQPHIWMECHCSPYHQSSAFYPVIELFHRKLELRREDSSEEKLSKLQGMLGQCELCLPEVTALFADLLSVPLSERFPAPNLTPQRQKQKTIEALIEVLLKIAEKQPLVFVVEDLHWADPSTLEMLSLFIARKIKARMLAVLTFRPEFIPPWKTHPGLDSTGITHLNLNRLDHKQVETMVEQITGSKALPTEVLKQIVAKTDGIPLFVEELTKMVLESGLLREQERSFELTGPLPALAIPATLRDSLMARLDRLAPVKEIAQLGATLGREFSYELLQAVSDLNEGSLRSGLARLVEAQLLYQLGPAGNGTSYMFKHALIQDAAYQSLLKSRRQQYHQRIAQVFVERFPETAATQPEILAHHYTEAGLVETAIAYWQWAGERAIEHSANLEAISHFTKGLELLPALPESPQRNQQELDLLTTLGVALIATKGYAAPEVEKTYTRARELCQQMGERHQISSALVGLWECSLLRAEFHKAHALAQELMHLAQGGSDPAVLLSAHLISGITLFHLGELASAREHLKQAITRYDPQQHGAEALVYGQDPGVVCLCYAAHVLWLLGYPDQALERTYEALNLAHELAHPFTLAFALNFAGEIRQLRGEMKMAQERAEELIALSTEQGFPLWLASGTVLKGYALFEQGQQEEGMAMMSQALAAFQAIATKLGKSGGLAVRAIMCGKMGRVEEGLEMVAEPFEMVKNGGEQQIEAELYRTKGELLKQKANSKEQKAKIDSEAEACFVQALEIARRQGAKSWELRAVVSLSRLWQKQGKKNEARKRLAEVYNWFTEGFETADLKEAKALLEALS
jgi:class 3 adenylate cyclase/predicted ATPase